MRKPRHILLAIFLAFLGAMARGEEKGSAAMQEAEALNSRGDFRATALLLEPLLANNAAGLSPQNKERTQEGTMYCAPTNAKSGVSASPVNKAAALRKRRSG